MHTAYGVGGVGVGVGVAGLIFGVAAHGAHQDALDNGCVQPPTGGIACNVVGGAKELHAGRLADASTYLTLGGVALIAAGVIIYFTAPRDPEQLHAAPIADAHTVGLQLVRAF